MKIRFKENYLLPHKNTRWAYWDGYLAGLVTAYSVYYIWNMYLDQKAYDREFDEAMKKFTPSESDDTNV